ncbi:hypothetical protein AALD22_26685 [Lachnospiraceae bacterium 56-18]|uniref:hypothetical protein n=1 Tax=Sporofaciens sp. JLR.KK001 TaxID=3112621 RepID=UPI002FF34FB2
MRIRLRIHSSICLSHFPIFARQAKKRIVELDRIFKRIYEDDISGAISHDRFLKLSAEYEAEQRELEEKVKANSRKSIPTNRARAILTASPRLSASMWG